MSGPVDTSASQPDTDGSSSESRPFQFSLRQLLLWVAIFAFICGIMASLGKAVHRARESARHSCCQNSLKGIALGLASYHQVYGCFPPAYLCDENGKPAHSWRVLILPFTCGGSLYTQYDFSEPWDGPNNSRLATVDASQFYTYQCPSAGLAGTPFASYVAVVGPKTVCPGDKSTKCTGDPGPGLQKIHIVEIADSDIHWMEPRDLTIEEAMAGVNPASGRGLSSHHPGGITYLNAGYEVHILDRNTDVTTIRDLLILDKNDPAVVQLP